MTPSKSELLPDQQAVLRALDGTMTQAGYRRTRLNWIHETAGSFVALSAARAEHDGVPAYSIRVGWRFDAFDDPTPDPRSAHGCVRSLSLDELADRRGRPVGAVGGADDRSLGELEQQLATIARAELSRWASAWTRPEGFRDFLAAGRWHLAAAWASALLGHYERATLEVVRAAHLHGVDLDEAFDRQRADIDEALSAVFAAPRGLASLLGEADEDTVRAFSAPRGTQARERVTEPAAEHHRLQVRHRAYGALCLQYIAGLRSPASPPR